MMKVVRAKVRYVTSYNVLNIDSLEIGLYVPFNILIKKDNDYVIIIEAGTLLSETLFEKLKKQEALYISKDDDDKQELSCRNLLSYIKYSKDDLEQSLKFLYSVNNMLFKKFLEDDYNTIDFKCADSLVKSIIFLVKSNENYLKETIPHFEQNYELPNHSLHVSIYAINLGYFLKFEEEQLLKIGTAGLLHDTGIKLIDDSITQKHEELTPIELKKIHQHPKHSIDIIKQNHISDPYIIDAISHHHERYDGKGYPDELDMSQIGDFASILAICDVFDALTNERPYRDKNSTFDALKLMTHDKSMTNQFNKDYLRVFLKSLLK